MAWNLQTFSSMKWHPGALFGPKSKRVLEKIREHYVSFEPEVCETAARDIRRDHGDETIERQCEQAERWFARRAARDGALLTVVPAPVRLVIDYRRTSRHIANMAATMLLLNKDDTDLTKLSSAELRDCIVGVDAADEADHTTHDLSLLGGLAFAKLTGNGTRAVARGLLQAGPLRRWWAKPLAGPMAAAAWNYAEVSIAARFVDVAASSPAEA